MASPEYTEVEFPLIQQLQSMGWEYIEGSLDDPAVTGRESFAHVFQEGVLREQLRRINRRDGAPWLDDERLSQAVGAITRTRGAGLIEANQAATDQKSFPWWVVRRISPKFKLANAVTASSAPR